MASSTRKNKKLSKTINAVSAKKMANSSVLFKHSATNSRDVHIIKTRDAARNAVSNHNKQRKTNTQSERFICARDTFLPSTIAAKG